MTPIERTAVASDNKRRKKRNRGLQFFCFTTKPGFRNVRFLWED